MHQHGKRDGFNSNLGALLAIAGSAIGLGNLWKFPYLVAENGGSIFILFYLLFILIICLPVMVSELAIGRKAQKNIFGAFQILAPGTKWKHIGILAITAAFVIISFYSVVGGWTMEYIYQSATNAFANQTPTQIENFFTEFTSSVGRPIMWHVAFMAVTAVVVALGVRQGIEKFAKVLMPLLFILIIVLAIRSFTLTGAKEGFAFLFKPDWSKFSPKLLLNALGQSFFSLSLGMGILVTYASYMKKEDNLTTTAIRGAIADTSFAIIAAVAIIPPIFAFGLPISQGPGLAFVSLPVVFQQMTGGGLFATIFFVIFFIAALTSSISILEVQVIFLKEEFKIKRGWAAAIAATLSATVGVICSLSFGVLSDFKIFGMTFFELMDFFASNVLLPLGSFLLVLFAGWRLKKSVMYKELYTGSRKSIKRLGIVMFFILKYIAPFAIILVFLYGLGVFNFLK